MSNLGVDGTPVLEHCSAGHFETLDHVGWRVLELCCLYCHCHRSTAPRAQGLWWPAKTPFFSSRTSSHQNCHSAWQQCFYVGQVNLIAHPVTVNPTVVVMLTPESWLTERVQPPPTSHAFLGLSRTEAGLGGGWLDGWMASLASSCPPSSSSSSSTSEAQPPPQLHMLVPRCKRRCKIGVKKTLRLPSYKLHSFRLAAAR